MQLIYGKTKGTTHALLEVLSAHAEPDNPDLNVTYVADNGRNVKNRMFPKEKTGILRFIDSGEITIMSDPKEAIVLTFDSLELRKSFERGWILELKEGGRLFVTAADEFLITAVY